MANMIDATNMTNNSSTHYMSDFSKGSNLVERFNFLVNSIMTRIEFTRKEKKLEEALSKELKGYLNGNIGKRFMRIITNKEHIEMVDEALYHEKKELNSK